MKSLEQQCRDLLEIAVGLAKGIPPQELSVSELMPMANALQKQIDDRNLELGLISQTSDTGTWESKAWGRTRCVKDTDYYSEHELEVEAGGFSSAHRHSYRNNNFKVLSGKIRIVWCYGWDIHSKELTVGNVFDVEADTVHQFQVLESGAVREIYYPHNEGGLVSNDDIIRLTTGNKVDADIVKQTHDIGILDHSGRSWPYSQGEIPNG